jgi:ABC-type cobalamin transport system ATPase subunit
MDGGEIILTGTTDEILATDVLPRVFGVRYRKAEHDGKVSYFPERI